MNEHMAAYKKIVELLDVDNDTADKLNRCIDDPCAYYDENAEVYGERGVTSYTNDDMIIWLGIVDILIENGKMFEFDWKVELGDFIYGMQEINSNDTLEIDENDFDEDGDIIGWLEVLHSAWSDLGFVIAGMDIDSDSFCLLITAGDTFEKLVVEAEKTGHKIALAKDM